MKYFNRNFLLNGLSNSAAAIRNLFAASEPGFWYEPSDLTTLYQDVIGTPVTAVDQPVGMMLDKSKGLTRGAEIIPDPTIANSTGWAITNTDGTHTVTFAGGTMRYNIATSTPVTTATLSGVTITAGKVYEIVVEVSAYTSGTIKVDSLQGSSISIVRGIGTNRTIVQAGSSSSTLVMYRALAGVTDITIDSISIKEILGNHVTQTVAASRPILKLDFTGYYLFFDGIDDSLTSQSINFTSTNKMFVCAGIRKPSDAAIGIVVELSATASSSGNTGSFFLAAPGATAQPNVAFSARGINQVTVNATVTAPVSAVLTGTINISLNETILYVNKVATASSSSLGSTTMGNYPIYIGRRNNTSLPFSGRIYSLIGRGALTDTTQIDAVEKYVNSKTAAY